MPTIATGLRISVANTPQAKDDIYGSFEDFSKLLDVLCNDLGGAAKILYSLSKDLTIEDGGTVTSASMISGVPVQTITTNLGATATIVDGMICYSTNSLDYLAAGEPATDVFSYVIRLSSGAFSIATVSVTVIGSNDVPVVAAASNNVSEDSSILGSVAATDADFGETATLTYALVDPLAAPAGLTFNADGTYSFDASSYDYLVADQELELTIAFTASDATSTSAPANLVITVTGTNDVPVAIADVDEVVEDEAILAGSVAATDADFGETATLTYALVDPLAAPAGLTFNADGTYSFDASSYDYLVADQELELTIAFTASDATSTSAPANLVITVTGTNDVPVAIADVDEVVEDEAILAGSVAATDADFGETATLTYALVDPLAAPAGLTFNADGTYSFDASSYDYLVADQELELTIAFTASDATSTSAPANLVITVTGTNDVPVAIADVDEVVEDEAILAGSVAATDADFGETATLTYALVDPLAAPAGLTFNADGTYSFDASSYDYLVADQELELTIAFTASDATSTSAPANLVITVTGTNDVPVAIADVDEVVEDEAILAGSVAATDADFGETATLTYALVDPLAAPAGLTFNADGTYSFDASSYDYLVADQELELTIAFTASDATSTSAPANRVITVTGTNDVPVAIADVDEVVEDEAILAGSVAATDADFGETATLTYALVDPLAAPAGLTFNADGTYSFDASSYDYLVADQELELTIAFTASDATSTSAPANLVITVTGTNDVPVAIADVDEVVEDEAILAGSVAATDADFGETATLTYALVDPLAAPAGLTFNADGTYSFDASSYDYLVADQELELTIAFTASDATSTSAPANLVITVTGTNDVPVAIADVDEVVEDEAILAGSVAATDADFGETATLTYALVDPLAAPAGLTFNADGTYSFDASSYDYLVADQELELTIAFTASDATSTSAPANLVITVTGTNDVPVAIADVDEVVEDEAILAGSVAATDADFGETATLTYALVDPLAAPAGLTFNADGTYSFDASSYDYLVADQELELTIAFTASDATSTSAPANLVITVTGTNDVPVAIADVDEVVEDEAILAGSVAATDADFGETATLTYALVDPLAAPAGLTFNADGTYSFDASSYDYLVADQELELTIAFTASDATSTSAPANLVITVTGTNDVPVLSVEASGSLTEDATDPTLSDSGTLSFTDADATDTHVVSSASTGVTWSGGSLSMAQQTALAAGFSAGAAGWTYSIANAAVQFLAAGETITLTYDVTVTDDSGAPNNSATEAVTVTITGTDEAPTTTITGLHFDPNEQTGNNLNLGSFVADGATGAVTYDATVTAVSGTGAASIDVDDDGILQITGTPTGQYTLTVAVYDSGGNVIDDFTFNLWLGGNTAETFTFALGSTDNIGAGQGQADTITGSNGQDFLFGGSQADKLIGNGGDDWLLGGGGNDTYAFVAPASGGTDEVADFDGGGDRIALLQGGGGWNAAATTATAAGATLNASDYVNAGRASLLSLVAGDNNKVVELQVGQTTAHMTGTLGAAVNAYVLVFNTDTGFAELWHDNNWSDAASRTQVMTFASSDFDTLAETQALNNSDFAEWLFP